jgi:diaminopimelate epimerase
MEGLGNDFVVISDDEPTLDQIRAWCDRRTGVGGDGVIRVTASDHPEAAIRMQYWNSDGTWGEMCGNGLRCVARYAFDRGLVTERRFQVETDVGVLGVEVFDTGLICVELGSYEVGAGVQIDGETYMRVSVGNPHAVAFVDEPDDVAVALIGPGIEHHVEFPAGTNVEFVTVTDDGLRLRVWERGAGETRACGTGAAAAVAAAQSSGRVVSPTVVDLPGGRLEVGLIDGRAWITGPATAVFTGQLDA